MPRSRCRGSVAPHLLVGTKALASDAYHVGMEHVTVRRAKVRDASELANMLHRLWPEASVAEHAQELVSSLAPNSPGKLPLVVLVAEEPKGCLVGFVEVGLRSHADGCNPSRPVGFIEGWYVEPDYRRRRVGTKLIAAAETWARQQGCTEMASDTWLHAIYSQHAHAAIGFEEVDRCVHYRKLL